MHTTRPGDVELVKILFRSTEFRSEGCHSWWRTCAMTLGTALGGTAAVRERRRRRVGAARSNSDADRHERYVLWGRAVTGAARPDGESGLSHGEIVAALLHTLFHQAGGSVTVDATDFWDAATAVKQGALRSLRMAQEPHGQITFHLMPNAPPG